ncbi:MAG: hypothetical protein VKJ27_07065 [Synechocystis sp.]|nr:hypothetical protein [Synechocystis sp.]
MLNIQIFIAILTALLVFLTSVFLAYDTLQFNNYTLIIPQWAGLLFAGITFVFVALDQILRGFVGLEAAQNRAEESQNRAEERDRSVEARNLSYEARNRSIETRNRLIESAERETRRTRIETRYRIAVTRFQLDPNPTHRQQLADVLALLMEYQDTL